MYMHAQIISTEKKKREEEGNLRPRPRRRRSAETEAMERHSGLPECPQRRSGYHGGLMTEHRGLRGAGEVEEWLGLG